MQSAATINFGQLGYVSLALSDPRVHAGLGVHSLTISSQIRGSWLDRHDERSYVLSLVTGGVWLQQPSYYWLGSLLASTVVVRGFDSTVDLVIGVSDEQLVAIEQARQGGDLVLQIKLQLAIVNSGDAFPWTETDIQVPITSDAWHRLLEQLGREVSVVIRVPSPLGQPQRRTRALSAGEQASLTRATARIREARDDLRDARYEQCAIACRLALENLGSLALIPGAREVDRLPLPDRTQSERWAAVYWSARQLANAAPHDDETTAGFVWQRADAEALLATTAALLTRWTTPFESVQRPPSS